MAVLAAIPPVVHAIHEADLGRTARGARASGGGHPRHVDTRGRESEYHSPEHRDESEDSDDDQLRGNPRNQRTDSRENEDRAERDIAVVDGAALAVRAHDIGVVAQKVALHLIEKALLLFREWHRSPVGSKDCVTVYSRRRLLG